MASYDPVSLFTMSTYSLILPLLTYLGTRIGFGSEDWVFDGGRVGYESGR